MTCLIKKDIPGLVYVENITTHLKQTLIQKIRFKDNSE